MTEQTPDLDPCLSSLDPSETNSHPLARQSRAQHAIHARHRLTREAVVDALWQSGRLPLIKRACKIGMCCVAPTIIAERDRLPLCVADRCRDRMCPTCQAYRAGEVRRRLHACLAKANSVRLVTLTMRHQSSELSKCVDAIMDAFRRLRRLEEWERHVRGGAFVIETTRGARGDRWHVHLHVLVDGSFWRQDALQACWSKAVGEPSIVDIRMIHERAHAVQYVTKYVSKSIDAAGWDDETLCDYAEGMHRRRLMGTFGKWHKVKIDELPDDPKMTTKDGRRISVMMLWQWMDENAAAVAAAAENLRTLGRTWRAMMEPYRSSTWTEPPAAGEQSVVSMVGWLMDIDDALRASEATTPPLTPPVARTPMLPWQDRG